MTREQKHGLAAVVNPDAELLEIEARLCAMVSKMETLPEETTDEEIAAFAEDLVPLRMRIAEMPAQGIGGVAVKLRQLMTTITGLGSLIGSTEWDEPTVRTALEAAERLAGGGSPAGDGAPKGERLH